MILKFSIVSCINVINSKFQKVLGQNKFNLNYLLPTEHERVTLHMFLITSDTVISDISSLPAKNQSCNETFLYEMLPVLNSSPICVEVAFCLNQHFLYQNFTFSTTESPNNIFFEFLVRLINYASYNDLLVLTNIYNLI